MEGWMKWRDGRVDGWKGKWIEIWKGRWMEGRMDE